MVARNRTPERRKAPRRIMTPDIANGQPKSIWIRIPSCVVGSWIFCSRASSGPNIV